MPAALGRRGGVVVVDKSCVEKERELKVAVKKKEEEEEEEKYIYMRWTL